MSKRIELTMGFVAIVDNADYPKLARFKWTAMRAGHKIYAYRSIGQKSTLMHRVIMDAKPTEEIDHRDGDGLNNRRRNLRKCTKAQNQWNRPVTPTKKSCKFKGVYWHHHGKKPWVARITVNKVRVELGYFETAEKAARAVNRVMRTHHGVFLVLNKA